MNNPARAKKKHHLVLTFYFRPDLSAGSFRNTAFVDALRRRIPETDQISVFTTRPNRYHTHQVEAPSSEVDGNINIRRIQIPQHQGGFLQQMRCFHTFYRQVLRETRHLEISSIYVSSGRLFSAYLASRISRRKDVPLVVDMRDLFRENICELFKNPLIRLPLWWMLGWVESRAFRRACHINLVSKGFEGDFLQWGRPLSFFHNGIDDEFLGLEPVGSGMRDGRKVVTYAGNMGEGQGLDRIIPAAAKDLEDRFVFHVYGDGGRRKQLEQRIKELDAGNVFIHNPIGRSELIDVYCHSDFLFMHLNQLRAFEKTIPSKVFEYGAIGLPIIAGVSGYSREFILKYLPDTILFDPCDYREMVRKMREYAPKPVDRADFISRFKRSNIMDELVELYLKRIGQEQ